MGHRNVQVYIILNFLAFDKPAHNTSYEEYDDDEDVRSPITSLLPTNMKKELPRQRSLYTFNLPFSRLIPVRFFINQVKRLSTLFANRILRSMARLLALILLSVCLRIKRAY